MISQRVISALEHGPASLEEFEVLKALARVVETLDKTECWNMNVIGVKCRPKMEDMCPRCSAIKELERALKECGF